MRHRLLVSYRWRLAGSYDMDASNGFQHVRTTKPKYSVLFKIERRR